jgi:hypothetical protein
MFSNLIYRSNITTDYDEDFNKVVDAVEKGENELLAVISSGISINIQNSLVIEFTRLYFNIP